MRYIRHMFIGMMLGSVASMLLLSKGNGTRQVMARVKRTINLLNYVGQELGLPGKRQG
ncbi:MAG: hypothetical protein ABFD04_11965 [Syntrophomonas sp.]